MKKLMNMFTKQATDAEIIELVNNGGLIIEQDGMVCTVENGLLKTSAGTLIPIHYRDINTFIVKGLIEVKRPKFYLAAGFNDQDKVKEYVEKIEAIGFQCTNSWQDQEAEGLTDDTDFNIACADSDCKEIDQADIIVILADTVSTTGGYFYEHGYANGKGKMIFIIGKALNIFMEREKDFQTMGLFLNWLEGQYSD